VVKGENEEWDKTIDKTNIVAGALHVNEKRLGFAVAGGA